MTRNLLKSCNWPSLRETVSLVSTSLDRNLKPKGVEGGLGANNKQNHNCVGILQVYARHSVGFEAALVCAVPKGMVFFAVLV